MNSLLTGALIKIGISIVLYFVAFLPTNYFPELIRNNEYSSFFYPPTGIKVLCILLFDIWGAIGLAVGVFIRHSIQHPELGYSFPLVVALENAIVFWVSIKVLLKAMGVGRDVENITYIKIVLLAVICSVIHGFSYTYVLFEFNVIPAVNYFRESFVTAISGLLGTMAIVLLLSFSVKNSPWLQRHMRAIEND